MDEIPDNIKHLVELRTLDIAIAGQKLDALALAKGGPHFARFARREVKRKEANGMATIEALHAVFREIAGGKLD